MYDLVWCFVECLFAVSGFVCFDMRGSFTERKHDVASGGDLEGDGR